LNTKTEFDLFLDKVRPFLLKYLESKGYNTKSAIHCLHPDHIDKTPSMLCSDAEQFNWKAYCTSCGYRCDIFDAYAILEDKPKTGPKWLSDTVIPLATSFNIPSPVIELSSEQQFSQDLYRVYEYVSSLIEHKPNNNLFPAQYIKEKKWNLKTLSDLDIGVLPYKKIQETVSKKDLIRFGLDRSDLFNVNNLIFTVRDIFGRPINFFARRPDENPKFLSIKFSNLAINLWRGKGHFYLSHLCSRTSSSAIIVEGHPDAVTLYQNNFKNIVSLDGCKKFSETHLDNLIMNGISRCTLIYDGDKRGQDAVEAFLCKDFVKTGGVVFDVVILPSDHDPDSYIRLEGKEKLDYLISKKLSSFEFLLSKENPNQPPEELCERLIPYIASSKSEIRRELMARELVEFTGGKISVGSILYDVSRLDNQVVSAILEKQKSIVGAATRQAQHNLPQAREVFRDALKKLDSVDKEQNIKNSRLTCLARMQSSKMMEERRLSGGYTLKKGSLGVISDILEGGDWTGSRLMIVGGVKNVGKSTLIDNFIWEVITNPDNNAIAFLLTLDDPAEVRFRRFGCCAVREKGFAQNMIANPSLYSESYNLKGVYEKREYAYSKLTEMIATGKLYIEDVRDGSTLAYAERRIAQIRRDNPESNIIFGLDNFHNCTDWQHSPMKDLVGARLTYAKRICEIYKVLGLFAAEYRKLNNPDKPGTDEDLADCLAEDSLIIDYETGLPTKISEIVPETVIDTIDVETFRSIPKKVLRKFDKGIHPCYRITLSNNSYVEGTCNHPLLDQSGTWTKIKNLKERDFIAVPKPLSTISNIDKIKTKGDLSWLKIKSIEEVGKKHVYDIEVDGTHNFIANGILCHNSRKMSYDPALTMHLFSDLDYKGEDKAILIHKHNGIIMPRVLLNIEKNKITSFKGSNKLILDFFPSSAFFESVPLDRARREKIIRKQEISNQFD
jgi:DNA primase